MKYISTFSGIEAASVAWHPLGFEPVVFADFDEFPSAVIAHHFPEIPNLGDVTKVNWNEYEKKAELVVGGSPCQSFSVAGQRLGMDDPRGNLALHFLGIVRSIQPRWFLFENVPGLLSSDGGRDFAAFLAEVEKCGYGFAYRILDAQFFGIPQRRRRLFVVGCADGDWRSAAAVLFEQESLCRDSKTGEETGESITPVVGDSVESESKRRLDKGIIHCSDVGPTMTSSGPPYSRTGNQGVEHEAVVVQESEEKPIAFDWRELRGTRPSEENTDPVHTKDGLCVTQPRITPDKADTLTASYGTKWNGNAAADSGSLFVGEPVQTPLHDPSPPLDASYGKGTGERAGIERQIVATPIHDKATRHQGGGPKDDGATNMLGIGKEEQSMFTLDTACNHAVFQESQTGMVESSYGNYSECDKAGVLRASGGQMGGGSETLVRSETKRVGVDIWNHKITGETASTMGSNTGTAIDNGPMVAEPIGFSHTQGLDAQPSTDAFPTLRAEGGGHAVMESAGVVSKGNGEVWETKEQHMSLTSGGGQAGQGYPAVRQSTETQHAVRRLTPTECERLQGFPDGWTLIPYKGKDAPQTHRYKALGNSMAVPVMGWLGQRIQAVDTMLNEMDERPSAQATKQTSLW